MQQWWQQLSSVQQGQIDAMLQAELRDHNYSSVTDANRQLDALPWCVSEQDWQQLELAVNQRQKLWQLVLADWYGPQQLLQTGLIPPLLVLQNPEFLPPLMRLNPPHWLPLLTMDVGFDTQGHWVCLREHASQAQGLGYLLQHRLAFNQVTAGHPDLPNKAHLAGFFRALLQQLQQPQAGQTAGIAGILVPPGRTAAYFEQSFLASYLDIPLMQGADLLMRDNMLWLKTLTGLQRVSAILRQLPDAQCDALELDSLGSGCAGFLQVLRQTNHCQCLNPPGAGLISSAMFKPFLAKLCQQLLGETLLLPPLPSYWLGESGSLALVLAQPDNFVFHELQKTQPRVFVRLSALEQTLLLEQIVATPHYFVAEQQPQLQTQAQALVPDSALPAAMRVFALANGSKSRLLPGALGMLQADADDFLLTPLAKKFKDVWVLADRGKARSLLQSSDNPLLLSRHSGLVPSRVADHLFWMGRYNERLNLMARSLRALLPLLTNNEWVATDDAQALLQFCLKANGNMLSPADQSAIGLLNQIFAADHANGIVAVLEQLLFNAQSVREYFAEDTWFVLDKLQDTIHSWPTHLSSQQPAQLLRQLDEVVLLQSAIYGLNNETMSRTQTLRLLDLGQHLERALQTCALLELVFVHRRAGAGVLEALLKMADTVMTYRRRYRSELHPLAVIDLLLLDTTTPRSVGYQCARISRQCNALPSLNPSTGLTAEQRIALEITSLLQLAEPQSLLADDGAGGEIGSAALAELLQALQKQLRRLSDSITLSYFNHATDRRLWQSF